MLHLKEGDVRVLYASIPNETTWHYFKLCALSYDQSKQKFEIDDNVVQGKLGQAIISIDDIGTAEQMSMNELKKYGLISLSKPQNGFMIVSIKAMSKSSDPMDPKHKEMYMDFLSQLNKTLNKPRGFKPDSKSQKQFAARIKEGYSVKDMMRALRVAMSKQNHIESKFIYLTPEFITRDNKLQMYANAVVETKKFSGHDF